MIPRSGIDSSAGDSGDSGDSGEQRSHGGGRPCVFLVPALLARGAERGHVLRGRCRAIPLGWEHGSADGRAEAFRSQAPGLPKCARKLANRARALVANGPLTPVEAAALLLETA